MTQVPTHSEILQKVHYNLNQLMLEKPKLGIFLRRIQYHWAVRDRLGLFGGAIRDFLFNKKFKDLDFIFELDRKYISLEEFWDYVWNDERIKPEREKMKETNLGGMIVNLDGVPIDIWELKDTYCFKVKKLEPSWKGVVENVPFESDTMIVRFDNEVIEDRSNIWSSGGAFTQSLFIDKKLFIHRGKEIHQIDFPKKNALRALNICQKYNLKPSDKTQKLIENFLSKKDIKNFKTLCLSSNIDWSKAKIKIASSNKEEDEKSDCKISDELEITF